MKASDYDKLPENVKLQAARDNLASAANTVAQAFGLSVGQLLLLLEAQVGELRGAMLSLAAAQAIEAANKAAEEGDKNADS